jgi:nucleoside-diphosphate-sugar epimerase/phytoene/squalene synthetase
MLPGVSRTFALSIQALPEELRDAVCVAYLLCRIVDTVEDDRRVEPALRQGLFDAFDAALEGSTGGDASLAGAFEQRALAVSLGPTETERRLVAAAGASFRVFAALPAPQREAISPRVAEMSRGMRAYALRADAEGGLRLRDIADLEKYCYYVAGTVGELLTDLFALSCVVDDATRRELDARAVSFGLGLQLVNILKDVAEDMVRGDCFLPVGTAAEHGLALDRLLVPSERQKGLALLRTLSARAREHLDRAEEYTLLWPGTTAAGGDVRLFCTVPLALALATLREVEVGTDALVPGRAPTVSRALVMAVFEEAVRGTKQSKGAQADQTLRSLFDKSRTGVIGRPSRPSATPTGKTAGPASSRGSAHASPTSSRPTPATGSAATPPRGSITMNGTSSDSPAKVERRDVDGLQPKRTFGGKVFVTGAAGHVGANLLHRLLSEDRDVRVLVRPGSNNDAIDAVARETGKKVEKVYGDLRDRGFVAGAIKGCDVAFHVAARVSILGGSDQDLRDIYDSNVVGTANLLRAAGDAGVRRTVVTGSLSAVGFDLDDPSRPSDETMPFYPFFEHLPYGRTKQLVEHEVLKACVDGVDAVIATSCAVLGGHDYKPSRMGRLLLDFTHGRLRAYLPGGFDFVRARDLVDGHMLALERGRTGHRYILSTEYASVDDIMEIFEEVSGKKRPSLRLPAGVMAGVAQVSTLVMSNLFPTAEQRFTPASVRLLRMERKADTTKAKVELGYKPTSVRQAIHEAYADFAKRGLVPQSPSLSQGDTKSESTPTSKDKGRAGAAA